MPVLTSEKNVRLFWAVLVSALVHSVLVVWAGNGRKLGPTAPSSALAMDARIVGRASGVASDHMPDKNTQQPTPKPAGVLTDQERTVLSVDEGGKVETDAVGRATSGDLADDRSGTTERTQDVFYPSHQLDRRPVPVSAPNPRKYLAWLDIPPVPFRLRLFVDAAGEVVDVVGDFPGCFEEKHIAAIERMFRATTFVPGNVDARDVPSYLDIEIALAGS